MSSLFHYARCLLPFYELEIDRWLSQSSFALIVGALACTQRERPMKGNFFFLCSFLLLTVRWMLLYANYKTTIPLDRKLFLFRPSHPLVPVLVYCPGPPLCPIHCHPYVNVPSLNTLRITSLKEFSVLQQYHKVTPQTNHTIALMVEMHITIALDQHQEIDIGPIQRSTYRLGSPFTRFCMYAFCLCLKKNAFKL